MLIRVAPFVAFFLVQSCASGPDLPPEPVIAEPAKPDVEVSAGIFCPGDTLEIRFLYAPELDRELIVDKDDTIRPPFIEPIITKGQSLASIEAQLEAAYASELRDSDLTVVRVGPSHCS